jgi:outer membrane biosynthesis protein TonB
MNIRTELLEALVRQCVREVLDQVDEENDPPKQGGNETTADYEHRLQQHYRNNHPRFKEWPAPTETNADFEKRTQDRNRKRRGMNEEEEDPNKKPEQTGNEPAEPTPPTSQPEEPQAAEKPSPEPSGKPEEPSTPTAAEPSPEKPEEPTPAEPPAAKGALLVNPRDKSKLDPKPLASLKGQSDSNIERILHQIAVGTAGSRAKVSLGAKRMAREVAKNPSASVYFYFGKMDPESDEIFLMADKSLNVAKDDSVQPGEITGTPASTLPSGYKSFGAMNDDEYSQYMNTRNLPKPHYGIDEGAKTMIKKVVNQILDGRK